MMATRLLLAAAALCAFLAPQTPSAPVAPADRVNAWREDLAYFAREFSAGQKDFDKLYPRAQFDAAIGALAAKLPEKADADIVLDLMRIVAGPHIGHTAIRIPVEGWLAFHRAPIAVQWFSDGLAVIATTEAHRDAFGLRVTRIGTLTPEQLEAAVAGYVSYERASWLRLQSQNFMIAEEVLRAIGQLDPDGRVTVTLARLDGSPMTLRLAPLRWREAVMTVNLQTEKTLPPNPARAEPARYYRWEILPGTKVLYVRYNRCADDPKESFAAFTEGMFAAIDANPKAIERVIVDLRANGGGDSRVIKPLIDGLRARKGLSGRRHLFALTSSTTFSSGLRAAVDLKAIGATMVGEAPGENLNSYSEVRPLTLPKSGLIIQYAIKFNRLGKDGAGLEPHIRVTRTIAQWLADEDPVLQAALAGR